MSLSEYRGRYRFFKQVINKLMFSDEICRHGDNNILQALGHIIGYPGTLRSLVSGEGGWYQTDLGDTTAVYAYTYDASAPSGTRFAAANIDAAQAWLGAAGDRFYIGCTNKFWAIRFAISVAKTTEILDFYYWNGALTQSYYMGMGDDDKDPVANAILEQIAQDEVVMINPELEDDWAATDNVLDTIPNTGSNLYWICFEVPVGGLVQAPTTDSVEVRGTGVAHCAKLGGVILYGRARMNACVAISLAGFKSPAGTPSATIAISNNVSKSVWQFRTNQNDNVTGIWRLPVAIDTSYPIRCGVDFVTDAAINTLDLRFTAKKTTQGTALGAVADDYDQTASFNVAAGNVYEKCQNLTSAAKFPIDGLIYRDSIQFELERTDNNGNNAYPIELSVSHFLWRLGGVPY